MTEAETTQEDEIDRRDDKLYKYFVTATAKHPCTPHLIRSALTSSPSRSLPAVFAVTRHRLMSFSHVSGFRDGNAYWSTQNHQWTRLEGGTPG
jgi:hypothetical protein